MVGTTTVKVAVCLCMGVLLIFLLLTAPQSHKIKERRPQFHATVGGNTTLEQLRTNGLLELPSRRDLIHMSVESLFQTYHSYLDNTEILCNRKLRMGLVGDGGWEVCDDEPYRPVDSCIVYSFGIKFDFSFDDDIARLYKCKVFSFDPSMDTPSHRRSEGVQFIAQGLGPEKMMLKKWELKTLGTLKSMLNHTHKPIDVLKMDIEGWEWSSLDQMVRSGHLKNVKQLFVEYHGRHRKQIELHAVLAILKDVYDIGFRKFHVHKNPVCVFHDDIFPVKRTECYEIHYVNVNFQN